MSGMEIEQLLQLVSQLQSVFARSSIARAREYGLNQSATYKSHLNSISIL